MLYETYTTFLVKLNQASRMSNKLGIVFKSFHNCWLQKSYIKIYKSSLQFLEYRINSISLYSVTKLLRLWRKIFIIFRVNKRKLYKSKHLQSLEIGLPSFQTWALWAIYFGGLSFTFVVVLQRYTNVYTGDAT